MHVPSRRENFNSKTSLQLGTERNNNDGKAGDSKVEKYTYHNVSRYESVPRDTLNVHDPVKT